MEAAAKTIELLTQHHLPEKPHQLAYSQDWRLRPTTEPETPRRIEEWHNSRVQYMTFLSHADRGLLLTRSYYDLREEPASTNTPDASLIASSKPAGEKKKLSLSDYKNKKTSAPETPPPTEAAVAKIRDADRQTVPVTRHVSDSRPPNDSKSMVRPGEPENRRHTVTTVVDMRLVMPFPVA